MKTEILSTFTLNNSCPNKGYFCGKQIATSNIIKYLGMHLDHRITQPMYQNDTNHNKSLETLLASNV